MRKIIALLFSLILLLSNFYIPVSADSASIYKGRDDFIWGMNLHSPAYPSYKEATLEEQIHLSAELGVKLLRVNISVDNLEWSDKFVELCGAYGIKVMAVVNLRNESTDYITFLYQALATRYDGKDGRGKIDFFQLDNEIDLYILPKMWGSMGVNGTKTTEYRVKDLEEFRDKFKAAIAGIKASGSDAETVINFSYHHYGFLTYMVEQGVDFDILGLDWYDSQGKTIIDDIPSTNNDVIYPGILPDLAEKFDKDILICESNCMQSDENRFDNSKIDDWQVLLDLMAEAYSFDRCIGFVIYELLDEPTHSNIREATLGLIECDTNGNIGNKKTIYNKIQSGLGGGTLKKITESELDFSAYEAIGNNNDDSTENTEMPEISVSVIENTDTLLEATVETEDKTENSVEPEIITKRINETKTDYAIPWYLVIIFSAVMMLIAGGICFLVVFLDKKRNK